MGGRKKFTCAVFEFTVNFEVGTAKTFVVKLKLFCINLGNKFEVNLTINLESTSNFFDVYSETLHVKTYLH